ncbi:hypothetical protein NE237_006949 [Protea cynaroides]|uniref:Uncharacterized protein n=1 Tax=Protea cynaroides TaxID=273540 RepID=A0A9Q0KNI7_9MAGN|nr:hypothetical protein NE237_006949 [Protea cynaroides]
MLEEVQIGLGREALSNRRVHGMEEAIRRQGELFQANTNAVQRLAGSAGVISAPRDSGVATGSGGQGVGTEAMTATRSFTSVVQRGVVPDVGNWPKPITVTGITKVCDTATGV